MFSNNINGRISNIRNRKYITLSIYDCHIQTVIYKYEMFVRSIKSLVSVKMYYDRIFWTLINQQITFVFYFGNRFFFKLQIGVWEVHFFLSKHRFNESFIFRTFEIIFLSFYIQYHFPSNLQLNSCIYHLM